VVVECVVELFETPGIAPLTDTTMLIMTGGREREPAELDALFAAAGRGVPGKPGRTLAVIESVPAQ
jgi:hypothetical protein